MIKNPNAKQTRAALLGDTGGAIAFANLDHFLELRLEVGAEIAGSTFGKPAGGRRLAVAAGIILSAHDRASLRWSISVKVRPETA